MKNTRAVVIGLATIVGTAIFFVVPFAFIFVIASKDLPQSNLLEFSWPQPFVLFENLGNALTNRDYVLVIAFINSFVLTAVSVAALVLFGAMVAYVWQRRRSRINPLINILVLAGLIVPPAVVPTIWVLQGLGLFKTMPGLILIEIAYGLPFCILLFRAFIATVPRELDEAAVLLREAVDQHAAAQGGGGATTRLSARPGTLHLGERGTARQHDQSDPPDRCPDQRR